uniref:RF_PROK_I domain-containing protein n=1 Tax=Panagrellus redivivus TaxID=6233 RepID=A0A7E4VU33_PANRE
MWRVLQASSSLFAVSTRQASTKLKLKDYVFPEIRKEDCDQKFISGWGPGGQKVNTAQNAVMLKHKPTGITVKVHDSRLLPENIKIAHERLKFAVDRHLNGDNSYQAQLDRLQREVELRRNRQRMKKRQLKSELQTGSKNDDE